MQCVFSELCPDTGTAQGRGAPVPDVVEANMRKKTFLEEGSNWQAICTGKPVIKSSTNEDSCSQLRFEQSKGMYRRD